MSEKYNKLFYLNPLPSWVYDVESFRILDVNQAALDHYGYTREEFTGLTLKDLRPKQEIPKLVAAHQDIAKTEGNIYFGVFTHQKKNGKLIRMEINGHKLEYAHRSCILVICQDVTEKERQYLLLQESEAKLKAATAIANLGYWSLDMQSNTLTWSDEVYAIWGVDRDTFDLNYDNFFQTIHPDDRALFSEEHEASSSGLKPHDFVHRIVRPDGSIRWVHELGRLNKDENGSPVVFEGTVQDITKHKEDEQHQKLLESVVTNTNDAVLITEAEPLDEPGPRIIYVNDAFTRMTGYTLEEVVGKTPRILQGPKSDKAELARLSKALRNWESCDITLINYKKTGEEFWIHMSITPVANEKGWFTHWISIERDVTQQKNRELEQRLIAKVTDSFNASSDFTESGTMLCKRINQFGEFKFVELWLTNLEQTHIHLLSHDFTDPAFKKFYSATKNKVRFAKSNGLPGKVWEHKKQLLWSGNELEQHFVRYKTAKITGVQSVLGIPLYHEQQVVGVLVIGSDSNKAALKKYTAVFAQLELQLGSELYRKRLESDLAELFDTLPDIICVMNLDGKFLKINKAFCELLGYKETEIVNASFEKFVHPEDMQSSLAGLKKLHDETRANSFENRYITKDGKILALSWTGKASLSEGLIFASAKNITEQKKLSELNQQAGRMARIGGWEVDLITGKIHWSDTVHELHETDPDTFTPDLATAIDFYHPDFQSLVQSKVENCINIGEAFDIEAVLVTAKRQERWVRAIGNAESKDGKAVRIYGSFQDIHERKIAEQRLQSISDDLPGVAFQYVIKPDGTDSMRSVSLASHKIWQLSPVECQANNDKVWEQIRRGGDFEEVSKSIQQSVATGNKWNYTWRNVLPNGELRWHEGFGTPNIQSDGTIIFNSLIFDITEEKKATLLYEETAEMARMGSWEIDLSNEKVYYSDVTREIHELDEDREITLQNALVFFRKDFRKVVENKIKERMSSGEAWEIEAPIVTAKGREKWVRAIGQSENIDGRPVRIFGSIQDIDQRKTIELRLQSITNDLPGVIFQYHLYPDGTDRLLSVSDRAMDIWQHSPQECEEDIQWVWSQIKKGGDYDEVVADITHSINTKSQWYSQWRNILPSGDLRWHEGYGTPNFLPDGTVVFNSMVFDVTEEKKAINLYDEASNLARIGSWELKLDQDGKDAMYWSPMLRDILEVDDDYNPSLTGGFEFYEDASKELIHQAVTKLIETGEVFDLELQIKTTNDKIKWVRCIGKAEFINGKCERIFGSYQDINDRKTAEIQLKTLTDNLPGVVFQYLLLADGTDKILYISEGCRDIWGLSPDDCLAHPEKIWQQIAAGGNMDDVVASINASAKNMSTWKSTWRNITPSGNERYYQGIGTPQKLPDGAVLWNSLILDITEQKTFEQNYLREQKERISVLESISDAFYALDEDWNFTYYNKEAENLLKKSSAEVLGKNIWEVFAPAKGTILEETYKNVQKTGESRSFEYFYPGDKSWYDVNAYPSKGGISVYFKNINDRIKAKKDLEKAFKEKETILESIGDAFFAVNRDWIVTYWNREAQNLLGKAPEAIVGKNLWEEYEDAIDSDFYRHYHRALETGEDVSFEEYYPVLNKWFEVSVYPSADGLSVYFKDVTLRKEADIRLTQANERFEKVSEATNDAIWDWNIKENTLFWGQGFKSLFGYEVDKVTPTLDSWTRHIHPEDQNRVNTTLEQALHSTQNTWVQDYRYLKSDGSYAFVVDRGLVIRDEAGEPLRMVGAMTDITDRKRNEEQLVKLNRSLEKYTKELERSNEELEQFAFVTSHDLQEPLRMISSFLDQLKRKYNDQLDEKAHQYIHFATDGAKRMKRIILDLLEYSRANTPSSEKGPVDLQSLLEEYIQLRRKVINESSATIDFENLPEINTYKSSIIQIMHNLLDNAIKYVQEGKPPRIKVTCLDRPDQWEIQISDNGIGIDSRFFEKIFQIFQRLHNKEDYNGTGIGLSIVRKHVEHLGGQIWLDSVPGEGSTFFFTIPKSSQD